MADFGAGTRRAGLNIIEVDDGNFNYDEDIFVETSQKDSRDYWIRPIGGVVNQSGPFTFTIEPMVDKYLQLNRTYLEINCKVVKGADVPLIAWHDIVAPVNLLGAVMWENVEVNLNGQPFSGASSMNVGYKAFIETMLSYDKDAGDSHLHSQFFYQDTATQYDNMKVKESTLRGIYFNGWKNNTITRPAIPPALQPIRGQDFAVDKEYNFLNDAKFIVPIIYTEQLIPDPSDPEEEDNEAKIQRLLHNRIVGRRMIYRRAFENAIAPFHHNLIAAPHENVNNGYDSRFHVASGSDEFDMYVPITHDFFKLSNHIGPDNKIDIKLTMYPHEFLLNSFMLNLNFKLKILDMKLHLHTIERRERVPSPHIERYLMNETQMHKQVVAAGVPSTTFRIHNGGVMPKTVIIAMANTNAADGIFTLNPFTLHHHFIEKMALIINGESHPTQGLHFNFDKVNALCSRAYHWMYENTGSFDGEKGNTVTWAAFAAGAFIVPFDLTPDRCNGLHNHNAEYGYIDLELRFSRPLLEPIYVLYELVFNKVVVNSKVTNQVMVLDIQA